MAGLGFVRNNPWVQQDRLLKGSDNSSVLIGTQNHSPSVPNGAYSLDIPDISPPNLIYQSEPIKTKTVVQVRSSSASQSPQDQKRPPPLPPKSSVQEHRSLFEASSSPTRKEDSPVFASTPEKVRRIGGGGPGRVQKISFSDDSDSRSGESESTHGLSNGVGHHDITLDVSENIEYGPGIVSRLRQKFLTLAEQAKRESQAARALHQAQKADTRRRAASVDNLIDSSRGTSEKTSTRPSRAGSAREDAPPDLLNPAQFVMSSNLSNTEHSRSVPSLNTLIKFFSTDSPNPPPAPSLRPPPEIMAKTTAKSPEMLPSSQPRYTTSELATDEFRPINFVAPTPEEPKVAHYKSPSAKPSEPLSALRERFEGKTTATPKCSTVPVKSQEESSEKSESPKPPSPPTMKPLGVDTSSTDSIPEFLAMRDKLRNVRVTETAASDLKSPPDPSDKNDGGYAFFSTRVVEKIIEVKPPPPMEFRPSIADHSPPPEEPLPPRTKPPVLSQMEPKFPQIMPDNKDQHSEEDSRFLQISKLSGPENERGSSEVEQAVPQFPVIHNGDSKDTTDSLASSGLSSDDEVCYEVSEAEQKSSDNQQQKYEPGARKKVEQNSGEQEASGLVEMHRLLNKFNVLKSSQEEESGREESAVEPWYKESTHPDNAKESVRTESNHSEEPSDDDRPKPPERLSLSTQHRLRKQEEPSLIDLESDTEKKPESTVELLRSMAHTIGKYFPDETLVVKEVSTLTRERRMENGVAVESEEETRVSRSQIVHDSVVDHGGIHYPTENETEEGVQLAGDGNLIRHSLLSLVSEEDLAALLEDEDEDFDFEMEGEHGIVKDKGCLSTARRLQSRGSISFTETPPSVYAYAQEGDMDYWEEGEELNETQYNTLCQLMRDDYLLKRLELLEREEALESDTGLDKRELQTDVGKLTSGGLVSYIPQHLTAQVYELGVTNRWAYGDSAANGGPETKGGESLSHPTHSEDPLNLHPNATGDTFSTAETKSSDLLF